MPQKTVAVRAAASVAALSVTQFAAYSRFAPPPNYIDSDTPPLKFPLRLIFGIIVRRWFDVGGLERIHNNDERIAAMSRAL
jgi:hypothetical protein